MATETSQNQTENNKQQSEMSAIRINVKTRQEVIDDFKEDLNLNSDIDPSNIDELSKTMQQMEPVSEEHVKKLIELQKTMSLMLIERFEANMEAFKKYMPSIYEQFKDYKPTEALEFICTSNGIPNLFFPERNEFFYKVYDPVELCNRQVDVCLEKSQFRQLFYAIDNEQLGQIHHRYLNAMVRYQHQYLAEEGNPLLTNSCPICIMLGCGLGYQLGHLYERIDVANMVLIEPHTDLFFASLHAFDWANLLQFLAENRRGIYLMIGQSVDQVFEDLNSFYARHGRMLAGFMWSMIHYRSEEINAIADRIVEDYDRSYATMGFFDDHAFAVSHGMTHIKNGVHFVRRNRPLPEKWAKTPCCVVANGPSLAKDLPFLRRIQDKVIIIACGTAVETLYNAGIKPTFYAATERLKVVAEHLSIIPDKDFLKDLILIAGDVIHPDVIPYFDHHAIFGKADENFYWMLGSRLYDEALKIQDISLMNPLVGNMGLTGSTRLGFKEIYLFGVDNGTKQEDGNTHPEESWLYNKNYQKSDKSEAGIKKRLPMTGEGNFGGTVATNYLYSLSCKYMTTIIRAFSKEGIKYYNCSDGLRIKEAIPLHSEKLEWWSNLPDFDRKEFVEFMDTVKTFKVECTDEQFNNLVDTYTFEYIVNIIIRSLNKPNRPNTRIEYVFMLQTICEIFNAISKTRDSYIIDFVDGSLYGMFAMLIRTLYMTPDEQTAIKRCDDQINYIIYFLEDAIKISKLLPDYCAEDHHKHLKDLHIGQDHGSFKATVLTPRAPLVTDEDRAKFPVRKFVKRYE